MARAKPRGKLIVFEGGEGAGKSTQIRALATWLKRKGHAVAITRQPGGSRLGTGIRRLLLHGGKVDPRAELLLYEADRAQHVQDVVRPWIAQGKIVLSDRYADSSTVYQGICRGLGEKWTEELNQFATGGLSPDLVFVLDLPAAVGLKRSSSRGKLDRMEREKRAFHEKVRRGFLKLARRHPRRFRVIDAGEDRSVIATRIQAEVTKCLGAR